MECLVISPSPLSGTIKPPPSKSAAHRAIICAALSESTSVLSPYVYSDDIDATMDAMRTFGADITQRDGRIYVCATGIKAISNAAIDCRESGSTLRFLIPIAAAAGGCFTFTGTGRLPLRPIGPYLECLAKAGISCESSGGLPLRINGKLLNGVFKMPGNVSSQFVTGLLLALPMLSGDSSIFLTTPLESGGYVDLTMDIMKRFGVSVSENTSGYSIKGGQSYSSCDLKIEGDWSQAAFWLAAGALGRSIRCEGLDLNSKQGDKSITDILLRFGAKISDSTEDISVSPDSLNGIEIDVSQIPDLVPILAAVACMARGRTVIKNASRLRLKESDRLHTAAVGLRAFGAQIEEQNDGLVIDGGTLRGGEADGAGDHRIVMALSIAAAYCSDKSIIYGSGCISKSYPDFIRDFKKLGGNANVIHLG